MNYVQSGVFLAFTVLYSCLQICGARWGWNKMWEFHKWSTIAITAWILLTCPRFYFQFGTIDIVCFCALCVLGSFHTGLYLYLKWISTPRPVRPLYRLYS